MDRPRRSDCTAVHMDGDTGWWSTSGKIGLPLLAMVNGCVDNNNNMLMMNISLIKGKFIENSQRPAETAFTFAKTNR